MSALARARRELTAAVAAAAVAGGLALSTGGQTWATATVLRRPPLPPATEVLTGSTLAPLVPAAGLLLLAAAVALVAVRRAARTVVGLLAALAGGVLAWSGLRALAADPVATAGDALGPQTPGSELAVEVHPAWPVLALVAGLLAVLAGGLVVVRGRGWPAMGRRYERPGTAAPARPETAEDRALAAWRALDRGEDPTDPAPERPGGEPGTRPG